jgi:hypothetical protein
MEVEQEGDEEDEGKEGRREGKGQGGKGKEARVSSKLWPRNLVGHWHIPSSCIFFRYFITMYNIYGVYIISDPLRWYSNGLGL